MRKIIAVIGPTASGKTSLAIKLAKRIKGELINTDSRQIYKHMNIGTAKGDVKMIKDMKIKLPMKYKLNDLKIDKLDVYELDRATIHLINIVEPDNVLSLAQYMKLAYAAIEDIMKRGKVPILVGGTGLYIDAITEGYKIPEIPPDNKIRSKIGVENIEQLKKRLKMLNIKRYKSLNRSDRNNPRRLIRSIELEIKRKDKRSQEKRKKKKYKTLFLMPKRSREKLYKRIDKRAEIILDSGLVGEVKNLIDKGYDFSRPAMTAISYPIVKKYIEGSISEEELLEKFRQGDRNYARRQITWFKRYDVNEVENSKEAYKRVESFLKK